jgi:AcrR family transcriptional regulator
MVRPTVNAHPAAVATLDACNGSGQDRAVSPKPKETRRAREIERTRQDIVEAAARVFAEAGYHDATMQVIAREAGFTAASLYTYFRSKDEIYEALVEEMKRALIATFDVPAPAGLTFQQRLELLVQRQLAFVTARRSALRVTFDVRPGRLGPHTGPAEYLGRLSAFLAEAGAGRLRCTPDEGARVLFGLLQAMLLPSILGDHEPDVGQAGRVTDLFLHGVEAPGAF